MAQDVAAKEPEVARWLYVGNIPRNVDNDELRGVFEECGSVVKAEVMAMVTKICSRFNFFFCMGRIKFQNFQS